MQEPWLIVGLGNPGPKYALTRHNIGFLFLDWIVGGSKKSWSDEHGGELAKVEWPEGRTLLFKPQKFMNLSGGPTQAAAHFYKIPLERILVVHDEVDIPFASMRFQRNRGHGGHNGVRDISEKLGSADYFRLRLGIGRPTHPEMAMTDHVLGNFSNEEKSKIDEFFKQALSGTQHLLRAGLDKTSSLFNK